MGNRFSDFTWTAEQVRQGLTRADALALLDQLSLSLTKRAYIVQPTDTAAASVLGHLGTALQDLRLEMYARMKTEQDEKGNWLKILNVEPTAHYGDAPDTRTRYKPYGGSGHLTLGKRVLQQLLKRVPR